MKMNAMERAERFAQVKATRSNLETLVEVFRATSDKTPAETVAELVNRIGYETARETVAELVNTVGDWDGRIYSDIRKWAQSVETAATCEELNTHSIYQPSAIHPAHINQIGQAMQDYVPTEEQPAAEPEKSVEQHQTPADTIATALAGLPCLTERVTVYVPATSGVNAEADNAAEVDTIAARLSDWFGGATIQPGAGCWMSETAGLVKESTTTVYAACTVEQLAEHIAALRTLCENLKKEMGQEAIAMSVNQTLYFI